MQILSLIKRKENNKNITKDSKTNVKGPFTGKQLEFDEVEDEND